jgi:hypothetical protein
MHFSKNNCHFGFQKAKAVPFFVSLSLSFVFPFRAESEFSVFLSPAWAIFSGAGR